MTFDAGPSEPAPSRASIADLVNRLDNRDVVDEILDLSDLIAAAWPNPRSMDQ
jgi:hypothetical protein